MSDSPRLFLFPGMGGLDPGLAELGAGCGMPAVTKVLVPVSTGAGAAGGNGNGSGHH